MSIRIYRDFVIHAQEPPGDTQLGPPYKFDVRVFDSPTGEGESGDLVTIDKEKWEKLKKWRTRLADRSSVRSDYFDEFTRELQALILPPHTLPLYVDCRNHLADDEGLRVRLRLPDQLAWLPWEYAFVRLHEGEPTYPDYWALDSRVSIVRHQEISVPAWPFNRSAERRVVVAMASPGDHAPLDLDGEQRAIRDGLNNVAGLSVRYIPDFEDGTPGERATQDTLRSALRNRTDIFHFSGHGEFKSGEHYGVIFLCDPNNVNAGQEITAQDLGQLLGAGQVRLAVLGACESGERDMFERWSSVATSLLRQGIPAVVAMQFSIYDDTAKAFAKALYKHLVTGMQIDEALSLARQDMRDGRGLPTPSDRDWGAPVLYLRNSGGNIFPPVTDETLRRLAEDESERDSTLADVSLRWARQVLLASPAQQRVLREGGDSLALAPADAVLLLRSAVEYDEETACWIERLHTGGARLLQQLEQGADLSKQKDAGSAERHLGLDDPAAAGRPEGISRLAWSAARNPNVLTGQTAALALLALQPEQVISQVQEAVAQGIQNDRDRARRRAALLGSLAEADAAIAGNLSRYLDKGQQFDVWWWRARKHIHSNRVLLSGWIWGGALGAAFALGLYRAFLAVFNIFAVGTEFAVNALWGFLLGLGLTSGLVLARPLLLQDYGPPAGRRVTRLSVLLGALGFSLADALVMGLNGTGVTIATFVLYLLGSYLLGIAISIGLLHQPQAGWTVGILGWLKRLVPAAALAAIVQLPALCEMIARPGGRYWLDTAQWTAATVIVNSQQFSFLYSRFPSIASLLSGGATGSACCFAQGGGLLTACIGQWLSMLDAALVGVLLTLGITAGLHFQQTWLGKLWLRLQQRLDITK